MAYNTRKHDAKMRIKKKGEAKRTAMLQRAVKSVKPSVEIDPDHPRVAVVILTNYLTRLEVLRDDLQVEFGDLQEFASASSWLRMEIQLALAELVKLRIKLEANG